MKIKRLADGQVFEGPDGTEVPGGFALVPAEQSESTFLSRLKDVVTHPEQARQEGKSRQGTIGKIADVLQPSPETMASVALTGGAGAAASKLVPAAPKVAGAIGRAATQGGIEAAKAAHEGRSPISAGVMGAGSALIGEGAMAGIGKVAGRFAEPAQALQWIRERIGRGASGSTNVQLLDQLLAWWKAAPNKPAQEAAGETVAKSLKDNFGPEVSRVFRRGVLRASAHMPLVPSIRTPVSPGVSNVAEGIRGAASSPLGRAAADVAATKHVPGTDVPFGALAGAAVLQGAGARHLPGGRLIERMTRGEEVESGGGG